MSNHIPLAQGSNNNLSVSYTSSTEKVKKGFFRGGTIELNVRQITVQEGDKRSTITIKSQHADQLEEMVKTILDHIKQAPIHNTEQAIRAIKKGTVLLLGGTFKDNGTTEKTEKVFEKFSKKHQLVIEKNKKILAGIKENKVRGRDNLDTVVKNLQKHPHSEQAWGRFYAFMEVIDNPNGIKLLKEYETLHPGKIQSLLEQGTRLAKKLQTSFGEEGGVSIEAHDPTIAQGMENTFNTILDKLQGRVSEAPVEEQPIQPAREAIAQRTAPATQREKPVYNTLEEVQARKTELQRRRKLIIASADGPGRLPKRERLEHLNQQQAEIELRERELKAQGRSLPSAHTLASPPPTSSAPPPGGLPRKKKVSVTSSSETSARLTIEGKKNLSKESIARIIRDFKLQLDELNNKAGYCVRFNDITELELHMNLQKNIIKSMYLETQKLTAEGPLTQQIQTLQKLTLELDTTMKAPTELSPEDEALYKMQAISTYRNVIGGVVLAIETYLNQPAFLKVQRDIPLVENPCPSNMYISRTREESEKLRTAFNQAGNEGAYYLLELFKWNHNAVRFNHFTFPVMPGEDVYAKIEALNQQYNISPARMQARDQEMNRKELPSWRQPVLNVFYLNKSLEEQLHPATVMRT